MRLTKKAKNKEPKNTAKNCSAKACSNSSKTKACGK